MNDPKDLQRQPPKAEEIESSDDTPKAGEWLELRVTEKVWVGEDSEDEEDYEDEEDDEDEFSDYPRYYNDSDGPVISIEDLVEDGYKYKKVTRWIFCAVTHVGSNYLALRTLRGTGYRVHLDKWRDMCRKVEDPDARIQTSVAYWQNHLTEATNEIAALMQAVGVEGRQLAPDTEALAVRVGTGPAEEHKKDLAVAKEKLPALYKRIEKAGKEMGKWMSAHALPLQVMKISLDERKESIDSRLLAVDLYTGISEDAVSVRKGEAAGFREKLHLMQRMHYMDEECLAHYDHGGMDFHHIKGFDKWVARKDNFRRLLPHERCAIAFRVRREKKERRGETLADFIRIAIEEEADRQTFLYIRNGEQLWRVACNHDFGEVLFPDIAHSTIATGESLWAQNDGSDLRTEGSLEQEFGDDSEHWESKGYQPFNHSSVYYDDISRGVTKMMGEYNRVAVLLQGLLDRSSVFHPHPKVRLWDEGDFSDFVVLSFDKDRAITPGPKPDFEAYRDGLVEHIDEGSVTIGQEDEWLERARKTENERRSRSQRYGWDDRIYSDNTWWRPRDDPGPGRVAFIASIRGGKARFNWERQGRRQVAGSRPWDGNYPKIKDSIRVDLDKLFNVSAYKPGDYKAFFDDPRTRAEYLQWAPLLLTAEEWHAQGQKFEKPLSKKKRKKKKKKKRKKKRKKSKDT